MRSFCLPLSFLSLFFWTVLMSMTLKYSVIPLFSQELLAYSLVLSLSEQKLHVSGKENKVDVNQGTRVAGRRSCDLSSCISSSPGWNRLFSACSLAVTLVWNCRLQQHNNYWWTIQTKYEQRCTRKWTGKEKQSQRSISLSLILNFSVILDCMRLFISNFLSCSLGCYGNSRNCGSKT